MLSKSKNYTCVFADLDKTLLGADGHLTDATRSAMQAAAERGITIVPCSGRALNSLPKDLFDIPGVQYAVTSNGVAICNLKDRTIVESYTLPSDAATRLFAFIERHIANPDDIHFECFIKGQGYTAESYWHNPLTNGAPSYKKEYLQATRIPVPSIEEHILAHAAELDCFDVIAHPDLVAELFPLLQAAFPELYLTNSEQYLIEISRKDTGKHRGMERFCALHDVPLAQVVAFGDGNNDVEMLKEAGLGIAVGNAGDTCKAAADVVLAETYDQDAVAHELCRLFNL